jgi:protein-L-isoaspartate(D-aspartate) O-methyltransferase
LGDVDVVTADALQLDAGTHYGAIAVTGSLPVYDERYERQLEIGGRLFVVVGEPPVMEARLIRRTGEASWSSESLFETVIDPLVNAPRLPEFKF